MEIEICALSKRYKSRVKTTQALCNVNLSVDRGEIVCVLGHNGAGKTTLVKSICGLLRPDEGAVRIEGRVVHEDLSFAHRKCGAVLEGSRNIYHYLTAYENLRYFGLLNGLSQKQIDRRADEYLRLFELEPFRNVPASAFSRGMQQKLAIIIALMKQPDVLLLDEPTLGLDILSSDAVIQMLKRLAAAQELSILITTHDVHLIGQISSRLVFMRHGEVIRDSPLAALQQVDAGARYRVTWQLGPAGPGLPPDAAVQEQQDGIVLFETGDCGWLQGQLDAAALIQLEKCSRSVTDIYKEVMGGHA